VKGLSEKPAHTRRVKLEHVRSSMISPGCDSQGGIFFGCDVHLVSGICHRLDGLRPDSSVSSFMELVGMTTSIPMRELSLILHQQSSRCFPQSALLHFIQQSATMVLWRHASLMLDALAGLGGKQCATMVLWRQALSLRCALRLFLANANRSSPAMMWSMNAAVAKAGFQPRCYAWKGAGCRCADWMGSHK